MAVIALGLLIGVLGVVALGTFLKWLLLEYTLEDGTIPMRVVITDGGRTEAGYRGKAGDCVTRSLAIATGESYAEIYRTVNAYAAQERLSKRQRGRSSAREGVYPDTMKKVMAHYGGVWVPTMGIGTGVKVHLAEGELPNGIIVARLSKHVAAVIDGVVWDNHDPHREGNRAVYGYWRFPVTDKNSHRLEHSRAVKGDRIPRLG